LILRGEKRVEYRTRATKVVGERFYIYAAGSWPPTKSKQQVWSKDLSVPAGDEVSLPWLLELARGLELFPGELPTGLLVGSAVIDRVERRGDGMFAWYLRDVERLSDSLKPEGHPQPVWWFPFERAA
jgi:hypothetical protein